MPPHVVTHMDTDRGGATYTPAAGTTGTREPATMYVTASFTGTTPTPWGGW